MVAMCGGSFHTDQMDWTAPSFLPSEKLNWMLSHHCRGWEIASIAISVATVQIVLELRTRVAKILCPDL
jgi:hypothetical protein